MSLHEYGWSSLFSDSFDALGDSGLEPARVIMAGTGSFRLVTDQGECVATLSGRLRHTAASAAETPTVGDWVAIRRSDPSGARIDRVLDRHTRLSRKVAGKRTREQIVAANVDTVFIVMGLDGDYNVRRLERLLTLVWASGARPVVLLNKLDLCGNPTVRREEVEQVAGGVKVLLVSCVNQEGIDAVRDEIGPRETAVLVGSSGVGKSTLINRLLGKAAQKTRAVREDDDRGRHTTTHRELFRLAGGGMIIDNPGIREVQLWSGEKSLTQAFDDIVELAQHCRFRDCTHDAEPGCKVLEAVEAGAFARSRLESFRSLRKEIAYLELRQDGSAQRVQKSKWRTIHREMRKSGKHRQS